MFRNVPESQCFIKICVEFGSEKIKTPSVARCFFFIKERKERKRKKGEERKEKKEKKRRERRKEKERPTKKREVCIAISC